MSTVTPQSIAATGPGAPVPRHICNALPLGVALLVCLGALSGCSIHDLSLPKGVYLPRCSYGILEQSQPARCMTWAEYKTAKEKARNSLEETSRKNGKQPDPRYEEWIP